jgi:hypothetical protein
MPRNPGQDHRTRRPHYSKGHCCQYPLGCLCHFPLPGSQDCLRRQAARDRTARWKDSPQPGEVRRLIGP